MCHSYCKTMKNAIKTLFSVIDRTAEIIITTAFSLMVLVGGMQVFCRYILRHSLSWSEEFQKYLHIWLIFLAIPLAYKRGAHIGMKIVFDRLPRKLQHILTLATDGLWFLLGCAMVYYATRIMEVAKQQTSPGLGLRMDIVYFCIIIGGFYLSIMALRNIAGQVTGRRDRGKETLSDR